MTAKYIASDFAPVGSVSLGFACHLAQQMSEEARWKTGRKQREAEPLEGRLGKWDG